MPLDSIQHAANPWPASKAVRDDAVDVLRLLADPTRLAIVAMLDGTEMAVGEIAVALDRPVPGISQHLAKLRSGQLVVSRREGTTIWYSQPDAHLAKLVHEALFLSEHRTQPD